MAMTSASTEVSGRARPEFADGVAFLDGDYVPIGQAKIPILEWGFVRSDVTYDVVHVWNGRFFRLDHHLDRFERSVSGLRMKLPHTRGEIVDILMELMRFSGLREACPCVECRGGHEYMGREHEPDNILTLTPARSSTITGLDLVGNYALQPTWDDGHHVGIYTWDYLLRLCPDSEED